MNRPPQTTVEAVANVQELLADKARWFGGDSPFEHAAPGEAQKQCVLSALDIAAALAPDIEAQTTNILHDTLPKYAQRRGLQQRGLQRHAIVEYNDTHKHTTILRWLRRAHAEAEARVRGTSLTQ